MAAEGRTFSNSVKESDYFYDFACSPCEKDGRNVEAIKYCADCNENLCVTCLKYHNKFAMMRGHKLLDQVQKSQLHSKQLPSQRCSKHGGNIIDVFCPEHDTVGCSTCISVDHSSCKGKTFIPDVSTDIKKSQELKELHKALTILESKLNSLKKLKGDNLQRLQQDKDVLKKEIQSVRKKMNEQLDKMEKILVDEADEKFEQKFDAIHAQIALMDDMLARVKHAMDQVKSDNNDADVFVSCKIAKHEVINKLHPLLKDVEEQLSERSFKLHTDGHAKMVIEGKRMFASIMETYTVHGAEYRRDINIRASDDRNVCKVYSMCELPDGCLAMTVLDNMKLKKLDPASNKVSTLIKVPDNPVFLCLVDSKCLAVTLYSQKKIQFVLLSGQVTMGSSFPVGDTCRGLAHCNGLLYVCCGGNTKEGRGHVEVYTCSGVLLRCLYEEFGCPDYMSVSNEGNNTTMYISDGYKGVQVRDMDGTVKHRFPTADDSDKPFCLIGNDQLCIGECNTETICIQTYKDKRVILKKNDLKGKPTCLYFDERSFRLFVAVKDVIKVFDLRM